MPKPELLAPAGSFEALVAAVQSGADAIYLGTGAFNARAYAKNFGADELAKAVDYCHARGVDVHVTMNTLLLDKELPDALATARGLYAMGVDALIVQDVGLIAALRRELPGFPLHASTQMAVHDENGVLAVKALGMERAVLAREVSLAGIRRIHEATGFPLESFAGGAMCTSVSGQCLLSSFIGGRSGNRGACAQPCRMKYRLNGKEGYLLSMKDLCMLDRVPELVAAGVCSLKIEGRMKRPEYVAVVTEAYRKAIDGERAELPKLRANLLRAFNRGGFSEGYSKGKDGVVAPERPGNWGVPVGKIKKGRVELSSALTAGDELSVRQPGGDQDVSATIKREYPAGQAKIAEFANPQFDGLTVFRTVDAALNKEAMERVEADKRRVPVFADLSGAVGEPLSLTLSTGTYSATITGEIVPPAKTAATGADRLRTQVEKLGDTPFMLGKFTATLGDTPGFVAASELNRLRREAAQVLEQQIVAARRRSPPAVAAVPSERIRVQTVETPELIVQAATPEQAEAALKSGITTLYIQPQLWVRERFLPFVRLGEQYDAKLFPVLPALTMDDSLQKAIGLLVSFPSGTFSGAVACNIGQIAPLRAVFNDVRGDYTHNVTNAPSAQAHAALGLSKVTLSVELTVPQIRDIISGGVPTELVVFGTLPMMHLLHCPIREQLGGRCADDCFTGAERELSDRMDYRFPLHPVTQQPGKCDVNLLNSVPLDGLRIFDELRKAGAAAWRLHFYRETPEGVAERIAAYQEALGGKPPRPAEPSTSGHFTRGLAKAPPKPTKR